MPGPRKGERAQVELYESSGGTRGTTLGGRPLVLLTTRGARTGAPRKVVLMRVEHGGVYAVVGSLAGGPRDPRWCGNLRRNPEVELRDGAVVHDLRAREVRGPERELWWRRAVAAFPTYARYQERSARTFPVFVLEPAPGRPD